VDSRDVEDIKVRCLGKHSNMRSHRPVFGVFALLTTTLGLYLATLVRKHHAWYLYGVIAGDFQQVGRMLKEKKFRERLKTIIGEF